MSSKSMVVAQHFNPKFNPHIAEDASTNCEHIYKVESLRNTLVEPIGKWLNKARLQDLIDDGIDVSVVPIKG